MNSSKPASPEVIPSECILSAGELPTSATAAKAVLIFLIIINIVTFPFTAAFNSLVLMAVRTKTRLRANKHNILLACLAVTDLVVGVIIQPMFIALMTALLVGDATGGSCVLLPATLLLTNFLCDTSLIHLVLISGERHLAMKYAYEYDTGLVTEPRLLVASGLAWFFSLILHIPFFFHKTVFFMVKNTFIGLSLATIMFCHFMVYREVCRHQKELSSQQVTEEARQKILRDKKAFKLTGTVVVVLFLSYIPLFVYRLVLVIHRSNMSLEEIFVGGLVSLSFAILNSLFNPLIYAATTRQFRVAFIELLFELTRRTVSATEAEEIEMRLFGSPSGNAVVLRTDAEQQRQEDQRNEEQAEASNRNENRIQQLNYNFVKNIVLRRHSI